jgi:glycosyltransferase involved in cell wall biosynthesis
MVMEQNLPKVSVVIPAYNAMTYLPKAVESVLRQTFTNFEVLIIDDGSSDHIVPWASQVEDHRVRLISQENQGLPGARNTGIAHAQGEYIAFLDADDLWDPTKLEKQVRCLEENLAVGLVHTWMLLVDEQDKSTGRVMKSNAQRDAWKQLVEKNVIACPSVIVRRCCFETVGVFDRNLRSIEDWDMWIRIASRYPFAVIKEPLAYYRQLSTSMSKNCQVMEQAFYIVIEKAFHSAPSELLYLKNRSYGHASLCLAWKALQSHERDYKLALHFQQQAISHYPQLRFSWEYIRLSLAIAAMRWFGQERYGRVLTLIYALRRRISNATRYSR